MSVPQSQARAGGCRRSQRALPPLEGFWVRLCVGVPPGTTPGPSADQPAPGSPAQCAMPARWPRTAGVSWVGRDGGEASESITGSGTIGVGGAKSSRLPRVPQLPHAPHLPHAPRLPHRSSVAHAPRLPRILRPLRWPLGLAVLVVGGGALIVALLIVTTLMTIAGVSGLGGVSEGAGFEADGVSPLAKAEIPGLNTCATHQQAGQRYHLDWAILGLYRQGRVLRRGATLIVVHQRGRGHGRVQNFVTPGLMLSKFKIERDPRNRLALGRGRRNASCDFAVPYL